MNSYPLHPHSTILQRLALIGCVLSLLLTGIQSARATPTCPGLSGDPDPRQQVVEEINLQRCQAGLPALKRASGLDSAAQAYVDDMNTDDYWKDDHASYDRSGGQLVKVAEMDQRIAQTYPNSASLGEIIGAVQLTSVQMVADWMTKDTTRRQILSPLFNEVGVGYVTGTGANRPYWAADFGVRYHSYPVVINAEQASTADPAVSLDVYGTGLFDQMCLSNSGTCTNWMAFQSSLPWNLAAGPVGTRTVTLNLRNSAHPADVYTSSDTIQMSAAPVDVQIAGTSYGRTMMVAANTGLNLEYPGLSLNTGPVQVSTDASTGTPFLASERGYYLGTYNEVAGYPADQLTTEYWFRYYNSVDSNSWKILLANPGTQAATVDIYVNNVKEGLTNTVPAGGTVLGNFYNFENGPV